MTAKNVSALIRKVAPDAGEPDHQAADRRADHARDVDVEAVERQRRAKLVLGHELRQHREKGRRLERGACLQHEDQDEERDRRDRAHHREHAQEHHHRQHEDLRGDEEFAPVDDVGERAGGQREQEHRQRGGGTDQRHPDRRRIERGHQPAGADAGHPGADIRHQRRRPHGAEGGHRERTPRRRRRARLLAVRHERFSCLR